MAFYQLHQSQKIPAARRDVWEFMAAPGNLKNITPSFMGFQVTGISGDGSIYPGMIITYKVKPLFRIPVDWVTEITHVREEEYFVDEQRIGPYRFWHHQHKIKTIEEGVLMDDIVTYQPPYGFIGTLANTLIIRKQLKQIFDYRREAIRRVFG